MKNPKVTLKNFIAHNEIVATPFLPVFIDVKTGGHRLPT